ncbi:MAG: putative zinc-binding protein [Syntrophomonas sp.]|nr:putative zinc-binding protein [Syntrophomonas sp.]
MSKKVKVIPCSGIGKVHGLVAREIALKLVNEICTQEAETECLGYIVTEAPEIAERIKDGKCITIDGCPKMCAAKSVAHVGGSVTAEVRIVDILKEYRGYKPGTATTLNDQGWEIVDGAAEKLANRVREIYGEE